MADSEQADARSERGGGEAAAAAAGALVLLVNANTSTTTTSTTSAASPASPILLRSWIAESIRGLTGSLAPREPQIVQKRSASGIACPLVQIFRSTIEVRGPRSRVEGSVAMGLPHRPQKRAPVGFMSPSGHRTVSRSLIPWQYAAASDRAVSART